MKYRVLNADLNLQCGRDFDTFREAVQYRTKLVEENPDVRFAIKDIK